MPASADMPRRTLDSMHHVPLTRAEMTHRIGRFYSGRPSWRTRLRSLRRRLGDGSLPLSEEEELIEVLRYLRNRERRKGKPGKPIQSLRFAWPLPPVLLATDGRTSFRYFKVLKNASTTIINLLLEITGEAAYHTRGGEGRLLKALSKRSSQGCNPHWGPVVINTHRMHIHPYRPAVPFAPHPYADIRFCVVRDPVERFVSGLNQVQAEIFRRTGHLPLTRSSTFVDEWLDAMTAFYATVDSRRGAQGNESETLELSSYQLGWGIQEAEDTTRAVHWVNRHFFRQTWFLGKEAGYYTHIFSTRRPHEFHALLSDLAGKRLSSLDANSRARQRKILRARGLSYTPRQLSAAQRRKIEALYADDYRVFGRWF